MKRTFIFKSILVVIMIALSILATDFSMNNAYHFVDDYKYSYEYQHEVAFLILDCATKTDSNYSYYTLANELDVETKTYIENLLLAHQEYAYDYFNNEAFEYSFQNTKTKKKIETDTYSESMEPNISSITYSSLDNNLYFEQFIEEQIRDVVGEYASRNMVSVNVPKNYELVMQTNDFFIQRNIIYWLNYATVPVVALIVCVGIMALLILFYPIRIVEQTSPFSMIKSWKGEFNILVWGSSVAALSVGTVFYTSLAMSGWLEQLFIEVKLPVELVGITCVVLWFLTLFTISCFGYFMKHVICHGIVRFIKEDTWSGTIWRFIKRMSQDVLFWDLSKEQVYKIVIFVGIHTILLFLVMALRVNPIWSFIYAFVMLFACKWYIGRIQDDYAEILMEVNELSKGNFDESVGQNVGIFTDLQNELVSLRDGFELAVEDKIKSEKLKTELISHVSHDLKTPLTCIKNYIELLQDDSISEETRKEYIATIHQYTDRLSTMIEDLFDVSKVNSGDVKLELSEINIIALIEQAQAECVDLLESRNLTVVSKLSSRNIPLMLDSNKTYRIFENIFTNIGKYAMPNSRVYLKVDEDDSSVKIEIKNVSEAQMDFEADEILERFARGDKSRHESGSGLGLAIIQSFVEAQQGTFEVLIDADLFINRIIFPK